MTMTRSKNSTFELRICGRSMILRRTIFFRMEVQWTSDMSNMYEGNILFPP
jgi:competence transcription factor ComK